MLSNTPDHIERFHELAAVFNEKLYKPYNSLTAAERVFAYFLYRASLPGNRIATDQLSKHGILIRDVLLALFKNEKALLQLDRKHIPCKNETFTPKKFIQELKIYLVYVWSNHGFYFLRESSHEKRTPASLNLKTLTKDTISWALNFLNLHELSARFIIDADTILNQSIDHTATVPDSINNSSSNFYAPNMSDDLYNTLSAKEKSGINKYFYHEDGSVKTTLYAKGMRYDKELTVAIFWLEKALALTLEHQDSFDAAMRESLENLILFLQTGDESFFKKHSIAWLKTKNTIDYCFGFIETYNDPKGLRGLFQAEATIKTVDMKKANQVFAQLELKLPVDEEFKRDKSAALSMIPNATMNQKIFGTGGLGPLVLTAAYCLPNDEEIRATQGSKQIIYPASPSLGALLDRSKALRLFHTKEMADWLEENDHSGKLFNDLWDVHCILHETIGHGSGKLGKHVFKYGHALTFQNQSFEAGDSIDVTHENIAELLMGYEQTIEELRAEIIALYTSVMHIDELLAAGFLEEWEEKIGKQKLQELLIYHMLCTGLRRLIQQNDSATFISGDHARANCTIMNYFVHSGACKIVTEECEYDGDMYTVVDIEIQDFNACLKTMRDLVCLVQRIKSTGDGVAAQALIQTYGIPIENPAYMKHLKFNERAVVGELKGRVMIDPVFSPVFKNNQLVDIQAFWPHNIFEKIAIDTALEMSTEFGE